MFCGIGISKVLISANRGGIVLKVFLATIDSFVKFGIFFITGLFAGVKNCVALFRFFVFDAMSI